MRELIVAGGATGLFKSYMSGFGNCEADDDDDDDNDDDEAEVGEGKDINESDDMDEDEDEAEMDEWIELQYIEDEVEAYDAAFPCKIRYMHSKQRSRFLDQTFLKSFLTTKLSYSSRKNLGDPRASKVEASSIEEASSSSDLDIQRRALR